MRFGKVSQIDATGHRARVEFPAEDAEMIEGELGMESYWLPVLCQWSTGSKSFCMPTIGEQVCCWMDENAEFGVILGGLYSSVDAAPGAPAKARYQVYADGTIIQYDPTAHELKATVQGTVSITSTGAASVKSDASVTVEAPTITLKGSTTVQGSLRVTQAATFDLTVDATGEITSGIIPLTTHKHTAVTPGIGISGGPTP